MFDVHAGYVVGEEHDLVTVEFAGVLLRERGAFNLLHDAGDEVSGSGEGVEDVDAGVGEGFAELLLEDLFYGADHEVDDGLWGIDDTVGVGLGLVKGLEELFVDGVEEVLLFRVSGLRDGGGFDSGVEAVERLEEGVAREVLGGDRLDDFFDFGGDDVALEELVVVEDLAEDALGEEVLDEHLLDGGVGEVGIDGLAA